MLLFLLIAVLPVAELVLLIQVGQEFGALNTVLLVLGTAAVGLVLARMEGLRTLQRAQECLQAGYLPAEEVLDGALIVVAAVGLLVPGLITDAAGLLLLFPPTRFLFKRWLRSRFDRATMQGGVYVWRGPDGNHPGGPTLP
ncbi:MAG: FxsA family protein [Nitrospirota bacterium]|nr:FxsA family protein [Nitrospirota bacterium]